MEFTIKVNNRQIIARKGETILQTLQRSGMSVPTLCYLKDLFPTGACRMCVVEVEGRKNLITACSHPVEEWMNIKTHSPRVIKARKTIIELLLSNHPDDCLYCERNLNCELQKLAEDHNIRERRFKGNINRYKKDNSNPAVQYEPSKCILCGRCIRTCDEIQAVSTLDFFGRGLSVGVSTFFGKPLNTTNCISCGQCIMSCPTAALHEKRHYPGIQDALSNNEKTVVVMYDPLLSVSLSEALNLKNIRDLNGTLNAILRKTGFDYVFETAFSTDLMINELSEEFLNRRNSQESLPLISSNCPAWVNYAEQFFHSLLPALSTCKSPQQMLGSLIKNLWAKEKGIAVENLYTVSLSPCLTRKYEGQRDELSSVGISEIDAVMTTRELAQFIRLHGIDSTGIEAEPPDTPFSGRTSASILCGQSGGLTEALIRNLVHKSNAKESTLPKISDLRGNKVRKEVKFTLNKKEMRFVAVSGMSQAKKLLDELAGQPGKYDWIEVMACPSGCINGGGQPFNPSESILKARSKSIYDSDEKDSLKISAKNPRLTELYDNHLNEAGPELCRKWLHTYFHDRDVLQ